MYRDISSYSKGDTERKPTVLACTVNGIEFRVHKYIHCGDAWMLSCNELNICRKDLDTEDMEEAKRIAVEKMKVYINERIAKCQKALEELEEL